MTEPNDSHIIATYHFNSHPHKEDDVTVVVQFFHGHISTHILTRRMTELHSSHLHLFSFQLTSSQGGWRSVSTCSGFWCSFQLTSSQGGWLQDGRLLLWTIISTHILTRRMTGYLTAALEKIIISTHILTRRMTCRILYFNWESNYFNSHPHKEDDNFQNCSVRFEANFNSHPHKEDDLPSTRKESSSDYFNSHPHKEDDPVSSVWL